MISNIHVHTPYSFSAFGSIQELVETAANEQVSVLGINDLNTADGFREFSSSCKTSHIFPIYNIEFSVENDITNMHANSGRSVSPYFTGEFSGKALPYPNPFPGDVHNLIASIWKGSQDRIWKIIDKLNQLLAKCTIPVALEYTSIRSRYARVSVYEQHIARALNEAIMHAASSGQQMHQWMQCLLNDPAYVDNGAPMQRENAIINNLLSFEKPAYVPLPQNCSLTISQARNLILQIGGIPCYQCKLDSIGDTGTAASEAEKLAKNLARRGIFAIEFIPQGTDAATLRTFMTCFHEKHFCVSIGTGHFALFSKSTIPLTSDGKPLPDDLYAIGFAGACIFAAHQEYRIRKQAGFLDEEGNCIVSPKLLPNFIAEGSTQISKTVENRK